MDVRLPDGTIIRGVPEGTTRAELIEKLRRNGYDVSKLGAPQAEAAPPAAAAPAPQVQSFDPMGYATGMTEAAPAGAANMSYAEQLQNAARVIGQGTAGVASGVGQIGTGTAELLPGAAGAAAARGTQALRGIGIPEMQTAGKVAGSIVPFTAGMRAVSALGQGLRSLVPQISNAPGVIQSAGRVLGGGITAAGGGGAVGITSPTGIEDQTDRLGAKVSAAGTDALTAGLLGAGGGAIVEGARAVRGLAPSLDRYVAEQVRGVSEGQFSAAQRLAAQSQEIGVPITAMEAVEAATKGGTALGSLQRRLEASSGGSQLFSQFMSERPQLVKEAVEEGLNRIAPALANPAALEPRLRELGQSILEDVSKIRSAAVRPYYEAGKEGAINPNAVAALVKEIRATASLDESGRVIAPGLRELENLLIKTPAKPATKAERIPIYSQDGKFIRFERREGTPARSEEYITDPNTLDLVRQYLRDKVEAPLYAAEGITKTQSAFLANKLSQLRDRIERNVPEFGIGRQEYERLSERIRKFEATASGRLGEASTRAAQERVMFPTGESLQAGQEREIGNLFRSLVAREGSPPYLPLPGAPARAAAPNIGQQSIRQELANLSARTAEGLTARGLPNQYGGAAFAAGIRGNPQYAANLEAAMRSSGTNPAEMNRLLDVLQATGYRQLPGSQTQPNQAAQEALSGLGLGGIKQAVASPFSTISRGFAQANVEDVTRRLSQIALSGPTGVRQLQEMAKRGDMEGEIARRILASQRFVTPGLLQD